MTDSLTAEAVGLDFGTTNTVVALGDADGDTRLVQFGPDGASSAEFRSALRLWENERAWRGVAHEAGPWAIKEYLQSPLDGRLCPTMRQ